MAHATTARPTVETYGRTRAIANIEAAASNLRTEIHRSVPLAQRAGAGAALATLEYDLVRAIRDAPATHVNGD